MVTQLPCLAALSAVVMLVGCALPDSTEQPTPAIREITDPSIESFLQEMTVEEHFSGVVLVLQDGQVVHAKGYGPATNDRRNDVDTAFHVASVTKQFTAAAILQLVERESIDVDGSINKYLPRRYRSPHWNAVTVHHLLSHSSGIPDYAVDRAYYDIVGGFATDETVDGMIREAMAKELEFEPGSQYAYSNLGYALLGQIVEDRTGTQFAMYAKVNVLDPLSMSSSVIHTVGRVPGDNEAAGLRWADRQAEYVPDEVETLPATPPDAGLVTTLNDFAKWAEVLLGERQRVLTSESVAAMTKQHVQMGRGGSVDAYGYGLGVGDRLIAHSGHVVGFRSQFILDKQTKSVIAVFSNNAATSMERIAFGLLTVLFSQNP